VFVVVWRSVLGPAGPIFFFDKQFGTLRDRKGVFPVVWSLGGAILKWQMIMLWAILVAFGGK